MSEQINCNLTGRQIAEICNALSDRARWYGIQANSPRDMPSARRNDFGKRHAELASMSRELRKAWDHRESTTVGSSIPATFEAWRNKEN